MAMRSTLKKAFEEAAKLPEPEQDRLAAAILYEIEADREWDEAFAASQDSLEKLADEAVAEDRAGKTKPLDPDAL